MPDDEEGEKAKLHALSEGQKTIGRQVKKIHEEDDKAIGITRLNILVLGILASGLSLSVRTDQVTTSEFLNAHVIFGIAVLIVSTVISSMAYTSSSFEMGIDHNTIQQVTDEEMSSEQYFENVGTAQSTWIKNNHKVHRFNAYAITWALMFSISGFSLFIGGLAIGTVGARGESISYILLIVEFIAILIVCGAIYNSDYFLKKIMEIQNNN
jgi:hypothetical protein